MSKSIDLTPTGLQTPEGIARVNAAQDAFQQEAFRAASLLMNLHDNGRIKMGLAASRGFIAERVEAYRKAHDTLCRAVAGAPRD